MTTLLVLNASQAPISTIVSSFDPGGRKTGDFLNGVLATYLHDAGSRLIGQQKPGQFATFAYDAVDNLLVKWHQGSPPLTMSYDPASRLTTSTLGNVVTTSTHDNAGNMVGQYSVGSGLTSFSWDPENRMTKIVQPSGALSTYAYLGYNGLRRSNAEPGHPTYTTIWYDNANYLGEIQ